MKKSLLVLLGSCLIFSTSIYAQNVGVGESAPSTKLEVKGDSGTDLVNIKDQSNNSRFYIQNDGDVGIGTVAPNAQLHTTGTVRFQNYTNGILGVNASGNLVSRTLATSGNGVDISNANGVSGNPTISLDYGGSTTGGAYPQGNFGQFENHGTYNDFNTTPSYWGWNYMQGNVNGPNTVSSQWYRGIFSLGGNYNARGTGGYSLELAYPRYDHSEAGVWMRTVENGSIGSWTRIDGSADNENFIHNQTASTQTAGFRINGNGLFDGGNVGIGTTSPAGKLHVAGGNIVVEDGRYFETTGDDFRFTGGADDSSYEWVGYFSGGTRQGIILYDGAWTGANNITNEFSITAENSNKLTLNTSGGDVALMPDGSGNVGVNTLSPVSELEVEGGAQNWNVTTPGTTVGSIHLDPGTSSSNIGNAITFGAHDSGNGDNAQAGIYVKSDGSYGTRMYLATTNSYAAGSKTTMLLNHDGNVGIGTTSPGAKLHINGTALAETHYSLSAGNGKGFRFWNSDSYKMHMGNAAEYKYGPVSDYSIKTNMSNNSTRGWTWGVSGSTPVMAVSATEGHMALKGALYLDCASCGSTSNAYPNGGSGWGDAVLQGRVFSTSSNLHLSPPGGSNVIINDTYRAAGGITSGSEAGLIVEGDAAINTTSLNSSYQFYVNGRIGSNGINETSDKRFKKDIQPLENSLDKLSQLQGVSYHWRQDEFPDREFKEGKDMGVIAQEVEKIFPEVVATDDEGYKSVQYSSLVPVLIEAIKEQNQEIQNLKNDHKQELTCLNQKIEDYENLFDEIDLEALKQAFAKENYTAKK